MGVEKIVSKSEFEKTITDHKFVVVHFYAEWATQCTPMNTALDEMAKQPAFNNIQFAKIEAEVVPEISVQHKISAVPTFIIFKDGVVVDTVKGANLTELTSKINKHAEISAAAPAIVYKQTENSIKERLKTLINLADIMVFMKGNPTNPRCGFSRTLIGILNETRLPYQTFDVLNDEDVRQCLKKYSDWPTYPQVYVKGEFIGGLDIIQELAKSGELMAVLNPKCRRSRKTVLRSGRIS